MIEIESSSGHQAILTPNLLLRFEWREDHWKHEMISTGHGQSIPRIWSLEGGRAEGDHARVDGPMYQQLHIDRDPAGVARALLVGQSGPHHFSASFLVEETADGVSIDVDVADRCLEPMESLAATYLIEASDADLDQADGPVHLAWDHPDSRLTFEAEAPARVVASETSTGSIRCQAVAAIDTARQTHRLRYRWRWSHSPGRRIWDHTA